VSDAPGTVAVDTHVADERIAPAERDILRRLAAHVAELADRPIEAEKRALWTAHNDLRPARPLLFIDPENGWREIITPDFLQCTGDLARAWEYRLRKEIHWGEAIRDDRVIEPCFNVGWVYTRTNWGLSEVVHGGADGGARRWDPPITNLDDLTGLRFPTIIVDRPATNRLTDLADDLFGDLLPVRRRAAWYWTTGLTWEAIKLRGLNQMMLDMYDHPAGLHRLMAFLRDGTMDLINHLEQGGLYTLNNEGDYVGSGGFGWTTGLPAPGFDGHVRTRDLWVLSESQETVGVSPTMFDEFVFPYQLSLVERFGLVCYGCCEPVDGRWHVVRRIPNLRRVSVSPWTDRARMAEALGDRYVYSLKPHPGLLAAPSLDEDAIRADIRDALTKAAGCHLEIIMKDNHTLRRQPERAARWVHLARQEIDRC